MEIVPGLVAQPLIPTLGNVRQGEQKKFKISLGYKQETREAAGGNHPLPQVVGAVYMKPDSCPPLTVH